MDNTIFFILIGLMLLGILVNIYFRFVVLKHYNKLRQSGFNFKLKDVFDKSEIQNHIQDADDDLKESVEKFIGYIRKSVFTALFILILILAFGTYLIFSK